MFISSSFVKHLESTFPRSCPSRGPGLGVLFLFRGETVSEPVLNNDLPLNTYFDISDKLYHSLKHPSAHYLMNFIEGNGKSFRQAQVEQEQDGVTADMDFGKAAHLVNLEPEKFDASILVSPSIKTKDGSAAKAPRMTAAWKEFESANKDTDKILLTPEECERLRQMNLVWEKHKFGKQDNERAVQIEKAALVKPQLVTFMMEAETIVRFRADRVFEKSIDDFKTCTSLSINDLKSSIAKWNYDFQGAFYLICDAALNETEPMKITFSMTFQQKIEPFDIRRVVLDPEWLDIGYNLVKTALSNYKFSLENNFQNGFPEEEVVVAAPGYRAQQEFSLRKDF
jgi:PDDEXK-like domain of unknown function (DUF3799)